MSTPAPPRSPGALQAAQQQLDELDALIQRMLTLPANPAEEPAPVEESAPTEVPTRAETPARVEEPSRVEAPETRVEMPSIETPSKPAADAPLRSPRKLADLPPGLGPAKKRPAPPAPPAPPEPSPEESLVELIPAPLLDPLEVEFRPVPLASDLPHDGEDEVLAPAEPFETASTAAQYEEAADEYVDEEAEPERAPAVVATLPRRGPLVRVNQAFDRATYPFGPAGYWLRSAVGRAVLGWVGVLLITGSVAWAVLDWLGWTW
jgi:hypothetical protein